MGTGRHGQYIDVIASLLPGSPFDPSTMLNKALCNVIASLIFARRFEYGDPYLIRMLNLLEESLTEVSGSIPEVGGPGKPAEPLLCCASSQRELPTQVGERPSESQLQDDRLVDKPFTTGGRRGPRSGFLERERSCVLCLH